MLSLRNGTAMAIILSIAFVAVAVGARDQLPGFASDSQNAATSIAEELPVDALAGSEKSASTGADTQIGQSQNVNDSMTDRAGEYASDDEQGDDHDSDHDDDDDFDGEDHDDDDD